MSTMLHQTLSDHMNLDDHAAGGSSFVLPAMNDEPGLSAGSLCIELTAHVAE